MNDLNNKIILALGINAPLLRGHYPPPFLSIPVPSAFENNYPVNNKKSFAAKHKRINRKKKGRKQ